MRSLTVLIAVKLTSLVLVSARTHHRHRRVFAAGTRPWPREDGPRPSAAVAGPSANAVGATSVRGELAELCARQAARDRHDHVPVVLEGVQLLVDVGAAHDRDVGSR